MSQALLKALVLTADDVEDVELLCPMNRLLEAGVRVDVAAPRQGEVTGKHGYKIMANLSLDETPSADVAGYAMLFLPGGQAPATLREIPRALEIAQAFAANGLPIAAICHGPQILISAGLVRGRRMTCYKTVADELKAAGADYQDSPLVVDGNFITSRQPDDIPHFNGEIMRRLGLAPA